MRRRLRHLGSNKPSNFDGPIDPPPPALTEEEAFDLRMQLAALDAQAMSAAEDRREASKTPLGVFSVSALTFVLVIDAWSVWHMLTHHLSIKTLGTVSFSTCIILGTLFGHTRPTKRTLILGLLIGGGIALGTMFVRW